jgi:Glycosyl hydrolases family 18
VQHIWRRKPLVTAGLVTIVVGGIGISIGLAATAAVPTAVSLPRQVYAPYFETWTSDSLANTAKLSGDHYFTMAFLQTVPGQFCKLYWSGDTGKPVSAAIYGADISKLRSMGGDVIASFGGSTADAERTEIADSCGTASTIAAAYESVISTYGVTRLDMDVEGKSLANSAGIKRRNQAIKLAESWAAQRSIPLQVQYTLPVAESGLLASSLAVLKDAVAEGARVDVVNVMAFDYFVPGEGTVNMGAAAEDSLQGVHKQLSQLYPTMTSANIWRMQGVTLLPGIDSAPNRAEVTSLVDAANVLSFAQANHMDLVATWALQRDNGSGPGTADSNSGSGISQETWAFSHVLNAFTSLFKAPEARGIYFPRALPCSAPIRASGRAKRVVCPLLPFGGLIFTLGRL